MLASYAARKAAEIHTNHENKVLDLAEIELTFPIAALTVLGFAWIARKVLRIHQCFAYC